MKLREYREKRDAQRTNEPLGADPDVRGPTTRGAYVVHQHAATRMHFDLRLEMGGVLASFAVPRGPTFDPDARHLAVHTEDHPIEYLDFEDVIPKGTYGAGPMIVWDRGGVVYLEHTAEEGTARGKIDFVLDGYKLRGRFALVRLKKGEKEWLLLKKRDAWAAPGEVVSEKPRSVFSGLTIDERRDAAAIGAALAADAATAAGHRGANGGVGAAAIDVARFVPMEATFADDVVRGDGWRYEIDLGGERVIAARLRDRDRNRDREDDDGGGGGGAARLSGDAGAAYPDVLRAVRSLVADAVLDGHVVAFDDAGKPSAARLAARRAAAAEDPLRAVADVRVVYVVSDVVALGGHDLRAVPLARRRELLARLVPGSGVLRVAEQFADVDAVDAVVAFRDAHGLEAVVAKRADSAYVAGASDAWRAMGRPRVDPFVVSAAPKSARKNEVAAASFAFGRLVPRGAIAAKSAEIARIAAAPAGRAVARVRYVGWDARGEIARGSVVDVVDDAPEGCVAGPPSDTSRAPSVASPSSSSSSSSASSSSSQPMPAAPPAAHVVVTNRAKIFFPEDGLTKGDLVDYYDAVAPTLLPHLADRPVVLVRHPDGIHGKSFFQWNVTQAMPDWFRSIRFRGDGDDDGPSEGGPKSVFLVNDAASLRFVANLGCIPLHVLACRAGSLDACDFLTIDFDVKLSSLDVAVTLARTLKGLLDAIGLAGFPKTSGQSGLHVLVPLGDGTSFDTARALCELLGRLVVARHPDDATMERVVAKRGARVYVDTGQTGPSRTIVAPYSVRAVRGAAVSTPLDWDEVAPGLDPTRFTMRTVPARIARDGDRMRALLTTQTDIAAATARLAALVGTDAAATAGGAADVGGAAGPEGPEKPKRPRRRRRADEA